MKPRKLLARITTNSGVFRVIKGIGVEIHRSSNGYTRVVHRGTIESARKFYVNHIHPLTKEVSA